MFTALLFLLRDSRCVLNVIVVCGMHEWGHLAAMAVLGVQIMEIRFSGTGIRIITRKSGTEPLLKSIVVLLAGAAVNIAMFIILREKMPDTALMSLGAGIYNLLPYSQLDGGAVLEMLILGNIHERRLRTALKLLRIALIAVSAVMVCVYGFDAVPLFIAFSVLYIGSDHLR